MLDSPKNGLRCASARCIAETINVDHDDNDDVADDDDDDDVVGDFNISTWPSLTPRFLAGVPCNLGSWIRPIEIQCVSMFQCALPLLLLSPRLL